VLVEPIDGAADRIDLILSFRETMAFVRIVVRVD